MSERKDPGPAGLNPPGEARPSPAGTRQLAFDFAAADYRVVHVGDVAIWVGPGVKGMADADA